MRKEELIEKYEYLNHDCFRRVDVSEVLGDLKKLDEPQSIKLKEVIARIKIFDVGTQKVWLNEILNELGSDYGTLKYKDGYEQGKLEGEWVGQQLKDADKIRQELNKPVVPQFVADWIEYCKKHNFTLFGCLDPVNGFESLADEIFEGDIRKCIRWCRKESNNFARAWLDGYTVEKEKRYYVRFKGMESGDFNYLNFIKFQHAWVLSSIKLDKKFRTEHTKKQLEEAGFGWVFDCEGIEIEEVEE